MEKKAAAEKKVLRIQVEFWKRGEEDKTFTGYTTDVSASGLFLACHSPFPRGTRVGIRIEAEEPMWIGGTVARPVKVPMHLRAVMTSGMGVYFDEPSDSAVRKLVEMGTSVAAEIKY